MTPPQLPQQRFRDIKSIFGRPQNQATFGNLNLSEFSTLLNQTSGTNAFDSGINSVAERLYKEIPVAIDKGIDYAFPQARPAMGDFGAFVSRQLGVSEDLGREYGEESVGQIAEFLPMLAGGPIGLGATAALMGARTLEQTDSPVHALASGVAAAGAPLFGKLGGQASLGAAHKLTRGLLGGKQITPTTAIASSIPDRLIKLIGSEAAMELGFEGGQQLANVATGQGLDPNLFSKENLAQMIITELPFALLDLPELAKPQPFQRSIRKTVKAEVDNAQADEAVRRTPRPLTEEQKQEAAGFADYYAKRAEAKQIKDPNEQAKALKDVENNFRPTEKKADKKEPDVTAEAVTDEEAINNLGRETQPRTEETTTARETPQAPHEATPPSQAPPAPESRPETGQDSTPIDGVVKREADLFAKEFERNLEHEESPRGFSPDFMRAAHEADDIETAGDVVDAVSEAAGEQKVVGDEPVTGADVKAKAERNMKRPESSKEEAVKEAVQETSQRTKKKVKRRAKQYTKEGKLRERDGASKAGKQSHSPYTKEQVNQRIDYFNEHINSNPADGEGLGAKVTKAILDEIKKPYKKNGTEFQLRNWLWEWDHMRRAGTLKHAQSGEVLTSEADQLKAFKKGLHSVRQFDEKPERIKRTIVTNGKKWTDRGPADALAEELNREVEKNDELGIVYKVTQYKGSGYWHVQKHVYAVRLDEAQMVQASIEMDAADNTLGDYTEPADLDEQIADEVAVDAQVEAEVDAETEANELMVREARASNVMMPMELEALKNLIKEGRMNPETREGLRNVIADRLAERSEFGASDLGGGRPSLEELIRQRNEVQEQLNQISDDALLREVSDVEIGYHPPDPVPYDKIIASQERVRGDTFSIPEGTVVRTEEQVEALLNEGYEFPVLPRDFDEGEFWTVPGIPTRFFSKAQAEQAIARDKQRAAEGMPSENSLAPVHTLQTRLRLLNDAIAGRGRLAPSDLGPESTKKKLGESLKRRSKDSVGFSKSLHDVLGWDGEQLYIGRKDRMFPKSGIMNEQAFAKALEKFGLKKAYWEAFKMRHPEVVKNNHVMQSKLTAALELGDVIEIDVHGDVENKPEASKRTWLRQRVGELQHTLDTETQGHTYAESQIMHYHQLQAGVGDVNRTPEEAIQIVEKQAADRGRTTDIRTWVADMDLMQTYEELQRIRIDLEMEEYAVEHDGEQDFAEQFGTIAPDDFAPYDSETGLGNMAFILRGPGLEGFESDHTHVPDSLGWVRGKFVMHEGRRIYRVDEIQSDKAQEAPKQIAVWERELKLNKEELAQARKELVHKREDGGWMWGGQTYRSEQDALTAKETSEYMLRDQIERYERSLASGPDDHPLFGEFENLAVRTVFNEAAARGADAVFMPDANTVMMSEGHDRATEAVRRLDVKDLNKYIREQALEVANEREPAHDAEARDFDVALKRLYGDDYKDGVYALVQPAGMFDRSATRPVRLDKEAPGNLKEYRNGVLEFYPNPTAIPYDPTGLPPRQAPGMRAAYDERLMNTAAKLTGGRRVKGFQSVTLDKNKTVVGGEPMDLGRHKESPISVQDRVKVIGTDTLVEDGSTVDLNNPDNMREYEFAGFEPAGMLEHKPTRAPSLFNADGTPQTNVTGRAFSTGRFVRGDDGTFAHIQRDVDNFGTSEEHWYELFSAAGLPEKQIDQLLPSVMRMTKVLKLSEVDIGALINTRPDMNLAGLATTEGPIRQLWLAFDNLPDGVEKQNLRLAFTLAHEGFHTFEQLSNTGKLTRKQQKALNDYQEFTDGMTDVEDAAFLLSTFKEAFLPESLAKSEEFDHLFKDENLTPEELRANLAGLYMLGTSLNKGDLTMEHTLIPTATRRYFQEFSKFLRKVYRSVTGYFRNKSLGEVRAELAQKNMKKVKKQLDRMLKAQAQAELNIKEVANLTKIGPGGYGVMTTDMVKILEEHGTSDNMGQLAAMNVGVDLDNQGVGSKVNRIFDNFVMTADQKAAENPAIRPYIATMHLYTINAKTLGKRAVTQLMGVMGADGQPKWDESSGATNKQDWERTRRDAHPKTNKVISDWGRLQQQRVKKGKIPVIDFNDMPRESPDLWRAYSKLDRDGQEAVRNMHTRITAMHKVHNDDIIRLNQESAERRIGAILAGYDRQLWKDAPELGRLMYQTAKLTNDPTRQAEVAQNLQYLVGELKMPMDRFQATFDSVVNYADTISNLEGRLRDRPGFWSEMRFGKYFLRWRQKDGKTGGLGFDSAAAARQYRDTVMKKNGWTQVGNLEKVKRGTDISYNNEVIELLETGREKFNTLVDTLGFDDNVASVLKKQADFRSEIERQRAASKITAFGQNRKLASGREDLDMVATQLAYIDASSRALARKVFEADVAYQKLNPDLENHPEDAAWAERAVEQFSNPDSEFARNVTKANLAYFVASNFSSHIVELSQPLSSFMPEMVAQGAGYIESHKLLTKAQAETGSFNVKMLSKKNRNRNDANELWGSKERTELMNALAHEELINLAHATDQIGTDVTAAIDLSALQNQGKIKSAAELAATPVKAFADTSINMYRQTTEHNARVAGIVGYEIAKKKLLKAGLGEAEAHKQAIEDAKDFVRVTTFSGGKANRPLAPFSGTGGWKTIGSLYYSLSGYSYNMLSMMKRYALNGYSKKNYPDWSAPERRAARKALNVMLAHQFAAAGALGMPFVGAALATLSKVFNLDLEDDIRTALADMFDEDDEVGAAFQDIIMRGAANRFLQEAGFPVDVGARLSMNGILGTNSYDGWSASQLFGPTGGLVENAIGGITAATDGDWGKTAEEILPVGVKKMVNLARNDGEIRDTSGNMLIDATNFEKIAYAVGFNPKRVAEARDLERLQRNAQVSDQRSRTRQLDQLTDLYTRDPGAARLRLQKLEADDPTFDARAATRAIAQRIQKKNFPEDARRRARRSTGEAESQLLELFGSLSGPPQEVGRLQSDLQVQADLGYPTAPSPSRLREAMAIDDLLLRNPYMTKAEAKQSIFGR
jgi:hypothetical protein